MPAAQRNELETELARLRHGQHLCLFYESQSHTNGTIVPFFRDGLARDDRCLLIADEDAALAIRHGLAGAGVDPEREIDRGALRIQPVSEAYLPTGRFDPSAMLQRLEHLTDEALADGFAGLRASGDMTWAAGSRAPGAEQLLEYEAVLNDLVDRREFLALCRYDLGRFPPSTMRDVLRVHPQVVLSSLVCPSAYYEPPDMVLGHVDDRERLRWAIGQLHEARAAKLALERAVEARDGALRARDEFLAVAAHELRTPLTAMSLQLQSLAREIERRAIPGGLDAKAKAAIRGGRHLAALVENMLDIARVATGKTQIVLHVESVDLFDVVSDVLERFRHSAPVELSGARGVVVGAWDRLRLDEVVTNLVSNATKYGRGGPVVVRVEQRDGRAHLEVRDEGIGIAPEDHARVFEPFERAASSDRFGGLGLGLFIARRIVEAHEGVIHVASAPGEGSTFSVELPLAA